jgi:hypothetical protein
MGMRGIIGASVLLLTNVAIASPIELVAPRTASHFDFVTSEARPDGVRFVRRLLPPRNTVMAALAQTRTIYLAHNGVTLRPGNDDAREGTSSIVGGQVQVPPWDVSEAKWNATVACFRDLWKEFDVVITDQDPGDVPHMLAVFGGSPQHVGMPSGVGGVSPFTEDCAVIENSVVFTFTDVFPEDPQTICEVMAQEVAHSYGLDHEMLASDPMTYLNYNGNRTFKDQLVSCGEFSNRPCGIGGSVCRNKQNSVALLKERTGEADLIAPTLSITSPVDAAVVAPGFEVTATAADDRGITMATLYVDDEPVATIAGIGPYAFPTDAALAEGEHAIRVDVTDGRNVQSQAIGVTVREGSGPGNGSDTAGEGDTDENGNVTGGCSTGGALGFGAAFGLLALRRRSGRK